MKRWISLVLSFCMVLSMLSMPIFAEVDDANLSVKDASSAETTAMELMESADSYGTSSSFESDALVINALSSEVLASGVIDDSIFWTFDSEGNLMISGEGNMPNYGIWNLPWYEYQSEIISVIIQDGVTSVGEDAFYGCENLREINLPNSVTTLRAAFAFCYALESIQIPEGITTIEESTFWWCTSLSSVSIPDSVTRIEDCAFYMCRNLPDIKLPKTLCYIGDNAFWCCYSLSAIEIPKSVTYIGEEAFLSCDSLSEIIVDPQNSYYCNDENGVLFNKEKTELLQFPIGCELIEYIVPDSVVSIARSAFSDADNLSVVSLPEGLLEIGRSAFASCNSLSEVEFPSSLEKIGKSAFYSTALTEIFIPESTVDLGEDVFRECTTLENISVAEGNTAYQSINGVLFTKDSSSLLKYPPQKNGSVYTVPVTTKKITDYAFEDCMSLISVDLPEDLTTIGDGVFHKCTALTSIVMPMTISEIPQWTFRNCTNLKEIYLPAGVSKIGLRAFENTDQLETVYYEGSEASWNNIVIDEVNEALSMAEIILGTTSHVSGSIDESIQWSFDMENCVLTITGVGALPSYSRDEYPWYGYSNMVKSIIIEAGISEIGPETFMAYENLTTVIFPQTLKEIEYYAFGFCHSLEVATFPNGLQNIGYAAFCDSALKELTIPESIDSIATSAFASCDKIERIVVSEGNNNYCAIDNVLFSKDKTMLILYAAQKNDASYTIPSSVCAIAEDAFRHCHNLSTIYIPKSVKSIGSYAFFDCTALTSIVVPEGILRIADSTFRDCHSLVEIYLPLSLTTIEPLAFYDIKRLQTVYYAGTETSWKMVTIGENNDILMDATILCEGKLPSGTCGDDLAWTLDSSTGVLTISGTGSMEDYYNSNPPWGTNIKAVQIEEGVTSIGAYAFENCTLLAEVKIPDSVTSIGRSAFRNCSSLNTIIIPNGISEIEMDTFIDCVSMTSVTIPASVNTIYWDAFSNCVSLTAVNYGATVAEWVEIDIYMGNDYLVNAYLSANDLSGICGENLTWKLDRTGTLTVSGSGDMYDYDSYSAPWNDFRELVHNAVLKEGVTSVGESAFWHNENLTSVELPNSLASIGVLAFSHCTALEGIIIPKAVDTIGIRAFAGCDSLGAFAVAPGNTAYQVIDGALFSVDKETLIAYPGGRSSTSYTIPSSTTAVEEYAFSHCDNLQEIIIPQSVTSLGEASFSECKSLAAVHIPSSVTAINYATFYNCYNLVDVTIPKSVTAIGVAAFERCTSLTRIAVPEGVTEIQHSSFNDCSKLSKITLPNTVTAINYSAFANCSALATVNIPSSVERIEYDAFNSCRAMEAFTVDGNSQYFKASDGVLLTADGEDLVFYPIGNTRTTYMIPSSVKRINAHAFDCARNLQNITIPYGVEELGRYSFLNCTSLTSITIPGSVETIGFGAFAMCDALDEVVLENGVSVIKSDAFAWCFNLSKVHLPVSIAEIFSDAFNDCESLKTVYYGGAEALWETVFVDNGNDYLINADYEFSDQKSLQAGLSNQTGKLRLCGVHEDTDTVMVAFYDQEGKLERIEMFTVDEVESGVLITEVNSQHTIKILQMDESFAPVTNFVVPG